MLKSSHELLALSRFRTSIRFPLGIMYASGTAKNFSFYAVGYCKHYFVFSWVRTFFFLFVHGKKNTDVSLL
jgi:hypothetical protein